MCVFFSSCNKTTNVKSDIKYSISEEVIKSEAGAISIDNTVNFLITNYLARGAEKYSDKQWKKEDYKNSYFDFGNEPTNFSKLKYFNDLIDIEKDFYGINDINYYLDKPKFGSFITVTDSFEDYHFPKNTYTFYIIKLEYNVVANERYRENESSILTIYDKPKVNYSYIVMMIDTSDNNRMKIIDSYPNYGYPSHTLQYRNLLYVNNTNYFIKNTEKQNKVNELLRNANK